MNSTIKILWISAIFALPLFLMYSCKDASGNDKEETLQSQPIALVIHGGAGTMSRERMTPDVEQAILEALEKALNEGYAALESGSTATEAILKTIFILEQTPWFNAGIGAVLTEEGYPELDASIMDGATGLAGAVAGVSYIKSPIHAAEKVMSGSPHVMLAGKGAEIFAESQGLEMVTPDYFITDRMRERFKNRQGALWSHEDRKMGTVGAVALDKNGNIAAGTSTGGMMGKKFGRIGDAPIIGAGTFAENGTCGVSATGHGEFFIRSVAAYDVAARMKYLGQSLEEAGHGVIEDLKEIGGDGGLIALDQKGNIIMPFNTSGMYRGFIKEKGKPEAAIFKD